MQNSVTNIIQKPRLLATFAASLTFLFSWPTLAKDPPQLLSPQQVAQLQRTYQGVSNQTLLRIATGNPRAQLTALENAVQDANQRLAQGKFPKNVRRRVAEEGQLAIFRAMLTPAANKSAILEIGRRGMVEAIPLLSAIATGKTAIPEGNGIVMEPYVMDPNAINSPADAAIIALGEIGLQGKKEVLPILGEIIEGKRPGDYLATRACTSMACLKGPSGAAAKQLLKRGADQADGLARAEILKTLTMSGDNDALGKLARDFNSKDIMKTEAAFANMAQLGMPRLKRALRTDARDDVRLAVIRLFGGMNRGDLGIRVDPKKYRADLEWASLHDPSRENRSKAIKMVASLYGAPALVDVFGQALPAAQKPLIKNLADQITKGSYESSSRARQALADLAAPLAENMGK